MKLATIVRSIAFGLGLAALSTSGCLVDNALDLVCDDTIEARFNAYAGAVKALVDVSQDLKASVGASCVAIAKDLGATDVPDLSNLDDPKFDEKLTQACTKANEAIKAALAAKPLLAVEVIGGECRIDASAQLACESKCVVSGTCEPGSVELRCEPGELSGTCDAQCTGECTVTTGSVECQGGCSGTCNGVCAGTCSLKDSNGTCIGKCYGECKGACTGTCDVVPPSAKCSGSCKGGCSVDYKAPYCEGKLVPPKCNLDVDCQAACNAQAQLKAECTPPTLIVTLDGVGDGALAKTLTTNLPALYVAALEYGPNLVEAGADVAVKGVEAADAAVDALGCAALYSTSILATFNASVVASASLSASIQASVTINATVGVGIP